MRNKLKTILAIMLVAIMAVSFAGCTSKTAINLEEMILVEYSGNNGEAVAEVKLDKEAVFAAMASADSEGTAEERMQRAEKYEQYLNTVKLTVDKTQGIKNGDVLTVSIEYNNDEMKSEKFKFEGSKKEITVEGLKDAVTVHLDDSAIKEDGLVIDYSSPSPAGVVSLTNNFPKDDPLSMVTFNVEGENQNLKRGQEITITATPQAKFTDEAYVLDKTSFTVKLDDMPYYVETAADLSDDVKAELKALAEAHLNEWVANPTSIAGFITVNGVDIDLNTIQSVTDVQYTGNIYLAPVDIEAAMSNAVWFEFTAKIHNTETWGAVKEVPVVGITCMANVVSDGNVLMADDVYFDSFGEHMALSADEFTPLLEAYLAGRPLTTETIEW